MQCVGDVVALYCKYLCLRTSFLPHLLEPGFMSDPRGEIVTVPARASHGVNGVKFVADLGRL
jgi:hypothetical protein